MEILNKGDQKACKEYEDFVQQHPQGNILQSLKWGGVKTNWDNEAVVVRDSSGKIVGTALILIKQIPLFKRTLLYSPHGPVCDYTDKKVLQELLAGVRILKKRYRAYMFRMDPCIEETDTEAYRVFRELGFTHKENPPEFTTIQARNNYVLDIQDQSAEEIFMKFHPKWRYNIRLAERKGVHCEVCGKEKLDEFYALLKTTGHRDGFDIRSKDYFERMLDCLGSHCRLYMCYYEGIPLSGAITTQYAGKTCYIYGASSDEYRNMMPNHLMQWTMIQWAIENKGVVYDFQGIPYYNDPEKVQNGVFRFKKGFNGRVITYAGEFDYPYMPWMIGLIDWGKTHVFPFLRKSFFKWNAKSQKEKKSSGIRLTGGIRL